MDRLCIKREWGKLFFGRSTAGRAAGGGSGLRPCGYWHLPRQTVSLMVVGGPSSLDEFNDGRWMAKTWTTLPSADWLEV